MQGVMKKFGEKIDLINKISSSKRKKHSPRSKNCQPAEELPIITNAHSTFTSKSMHSKNVQEVSQFSRKRLQNELDHIINGALMNYKNHQINKVIFASPLTNRLSLGRTYHRSSRFATLDFEPGRYHSPERRLDLTIKRELPNINYASVKINNQHNFITQIIPMKSVIQDKPNYQQSCIFYTTPQHSELLKKPTFGRYLKRNGKEKTIKMKQVRFSPWNSEDGQDSLMP